MVRFILIVLLLLLVPVFQVGCSRFVHPIWTPEMIRFHLFPPDAISKARGLQYDWMPLSQIPRQQVHLIWASEDQRFFDHGGIDWDEIQEALEEARTSGKKPRGASTISMQAARCVFLWQGRSWVRKGLEAYYTVLMELLLPKRRILELYLNTIEFGPGVFGVRAAAETFYQKMPAELSRNQMAMLAAVMPNPKAWNPTEPTPRLLRRQQRVLKLATRSQFPWAEVEDARGAADERKK
jgi:monofunctional biosynthetic peptidoglycan transglycosylase